MRTLAYITLASATFSAVVAQSPVETGASAPTVITVDLSKAPGSAVTATAPAATAPLPFVVGKAAGKAKKPPASAGGTWKWTTFNRSGQPCENVLTLAVAKNGKISGKLIDRTGEHEIKNATLGDGVLTFDLKFHTRGEGDLPHTYTVSLDPDNPQVSVDRPDLTPFGKSHGGKHHADHSAKHDPNG